MSLGTSSTAEQRARTGDEHGMQPPHLLRQVLHASTRRLRSGSFTGERSPRSPQRYLLWIGDSPIHMHRAFVRCKLWLLARPELHPDCSGTQVNQMAGTLNCLDSPPRCTPYPNTSPSQPIRTEPCCPSLFMATIAPSKL